MKLYIASSWRNAHYPAVVEALRAAGFDVYDFRNPGEGKPAFKWEYVSERWLDWSPEEYRDNLEHPKSVAQFANDLEAMEQCDACVLVLPCGRSAHTEAGWFAGKGRKTVVLIPEKQEPELMYKLFDGVACNINEVIELLNK